MPSVVKTYGLRFQPSGKLISKRNLLNVKCYGDLVININCRWIDRYTCT